VKLNKIMCGALLAMGFISAAQANQGSGTVNFTGAIIDAPCSIKPESLDQTVELGQIANAALSAGSNTGASVPRAFDIKLENCAFTGDKTVEVTFKGPHSQFDTDSLALLGNTSSASIVLTDFSNNKVVLDTPTAVQKLTTGNNTLRFYAYVQASSGPASAIVPGSFQSAAQFELNYL